MKKKLLSILLACLMVLTLVACGGDKKDDQKDEVKDKAEDAEDKADGNEIIKIGQIGPQTGDVAVYGLTTLDGIKLAVKEINEAGGINGKQIELLDEDDKGDPTEATTIYNKLFEEGVDAIIGSVTSKPTDAVAAIAVDDGIPLITPTGTMAVITEGRDNVFRTCFTDPYQGQILAMFAADSLKAKTAAVMRNTSDDYSNGVADAFIQFAKEKDIEIVADEGYGAGDQDFNVQLTNIAQTNPDVLLVPDYYQTDVMIAKQARDLGIEATIIGPDGWDGVLDVVDADALDNLEGVYFTNHYSVDDQADVVKTFVENYNAEYGSNPSSFSALGYDSVYLLKAAWEKVGSTDFAKTVEALKGIEHEGVTGFLTYGENNNPIKTSPIITIENGAYKFYESVSTD
ncbi:MAG TPA: ABC transporter substrate-binding protein [Clostridiaceae bacterium]|nr:ABC transporter substrate-binding protein [Clostridiaceae bacterium]